MVRVPPLARFSFAAGKQGEIAKTLRLAPAPLDYTGNAAAV
jgi:hypothetical protein